MRRSSNISSEDLIQIAAIDRKADDARAHGAVGLLVIRSSIGDARYTWPDRASVRAAEYRLYGPMRERPLAVAAISERAARSTRQALERRQQLRATMQPGVLATPVVMDNILGIVEGRSSSSGVVVVGAHLDHDGIDEAGRIYNGADDNASGTAAVLAMAAAFARAAAQGARPARAIVFALWNGEEKGSLGAEHFAGAPGARAPHRRQHQPRHDRPPTKTFPTRTTRGSAAFPGATPSQNSNVVHLLGYTYSPDLARIVGRGERGDPPDDQSRTTIGTRRACCADRTTGRSCSAACPRCS